MKLLILGATGRIGRHWLSLAAMDGHEVTALVRDPSRMPLTHANIQVVQGDATNLEDLIQASKGADAVLSALSTDGGQVLSDCGPLLVQAMQLNGIKRILTIGTAGILDSRTEPGLLRYQSNESRRTLTRAAQEHHRFYLELLQSDLDWTIVCPTYLPDGEQTGQYRVERNMLPMDGRQISVPDTAAFAYMQLYEDTYVRARVGIAY
ncbi:NAD(P)-dependent oxidoreductase [Paenibacillus sp. R14(2021)]|uniref:NAD(P)-dependent oxidoreductase n=1 Tax=Paenibacillus sp. R14(2021) TaxID=2859228 RepID=UPI001C6149D0|nr:SDR family oxidoreductase [Paenibacillus sp. R14(2021)]